MADVNFSKYEKKSILLGVLTLYYYLVAIIETNRLMAELHGNRWLIFNYDDSGLVGFTKANHDGFYIVGVGRRSRANLRSRSFN